MLICDKIRSSTWNLNITCGKLRLEQHSNDRRMNKPGFLWRSLTFLWTCIYRRNCVDLIFQFLWYTRTNGPSTNTILYVFFSSSLRTRSRLRMSMIWSLSKQNIAIWLKNEAIIMIWILSCKKKLSVNAVRVKALRHLDFKTDLKNDEKSRLWVRTFTWGNSSLVETLVNVDVPFMTAAYSHCNACRGHDSSPDIHTSPYVWQWAIYAGFHSGTMTILKGFQ